MSRVAVVTGGTRGIGAAISKALKVAGYQVAATYHGNDEAAAKFKAETGVQTYKWDVSSFEACSTGLAQVAKDLGPVDVLVNNAGITKDGMFHKMTPEQWYAVINTNLNSLFNMTRPVIDGMRERGFGRIINISSVNGQKGQMGQVNYSASKAGDLGFTKALAQENANKGITVNAICPGYIATEMVMAVPKDVLEKSILPQIAVRRLGQPEEIARCVVFLAADEAGFCYGHHALGQRRPVDDLRGTPDREIGGSRDRTYARLSLGTAPEPQGRRCPRGTGERTDCRASWGAIDHGRIPPSQTIPDHMDYPADHTPVVHARNATRPREKGSMRLS